MDNDITPVLLPAQPTIHDIMEQPHNCNEQLLSQPPRTDVTGLSGERIVLQKGKKVRPVCRIIG